MANIFVFKNLQKIAIPAVLMLICSLAYSSQILFYHIDPFPLNSQQAILFNVLVACLFVSYARSCYEDPGSVPQSLKLSSERDPKSISQRWCFKCDAAKPMRAHHCKVCKRCILKMDHHCPWTANCVGHRTLPHFMRFLFYAVAAVSYLEYFLYIRLSVIWENRHLPHYHGPSMLQLAHLFILTVVNSITLFVLGILVITTIQSIATNVTTIEGYEIERHETLLRRARSKGGFIYGPNGMTIRLVKQEFPYDIGIWQNIVQGMGTRNVLAWFWPLSASPSSESGVVFEVNGFEEAHITWPPPDPDRFTVPEKLSNSSGTSNPRNFSLQAELDAFNERRAGDYERLSAPESSTNRREVYSNYDNNEDAASFDEDSEDD